MFGGGGFIGRYVCEGLFKSGVRVRVAQRNPRQAYIIQPLGQVGQFGFVQADITNATSVRHAVKGATAVDQSVRRVRHGDAPVHVDGARNVAEAARDAGAGHWSTSRRSAPIRNRSPIYGRTKGEGEAAVRKAFPKATIIRPSLVFGPEDELTNRFAGNGAAAVPSGDRCQTQFPAGLCPRSRASDRHGRARSARPTAARPTRSAGRR